jgi:hypothetical protein
MTRYIEKRTGEQIRDVECELDDTGEEMMCRGKTRDDMIEFKIPISGMKEIQRRGPPR